jgi:hypothetical protein
MKNKAAALFIIFSFSFSALDLCAQDYDDIIINPFWSFYSPNYSDVTSSGRGNTGIGSIGNTVSSSYLNPASLNIPGKYQANIQYIYKSNQEWLPTLTSGMHLKQNVFSGFAGFGMKISKEFQGAVTYSNPHSFTLDIGTIFITDEFGNIIGSYEAEEKLVVHSLSAPMVYDFGMIRIGLSLNYNFYRRTANFSNDDFTGKFDRFNIQGGIIVQPAKDFTLGLTFSPEATGQVEGGFDTLVEYTKAHIPLKVGGGAEYNFKKSGLKISADVTYTKNSVRKGLKDQLSFNGGIEYDVNKNFTLRAGGFNIQDPRDFETANYINENESYSQVFLTFGGTYRTKKAEFSLALMDSHVSSGVIKLLLINAGAAFNF